MHHYETLRSTSFHRFRPGRQNIKIRKQNWRKHAPPVLEPGRIGQETRIEAHRLGADA